MTERKTLFVDVIVPLPMRKAFTFRVPFELNDRIKKGIRVIVPFGKSKLLTGIVWKIHENVPEYTTKYIEHILDEDPIITPTQFKFWKWISDYYMAPIGDVMNASLPANFKLASETKVVFHPDIDLEKHQLSERESAIVEVLEQREELDLKEISEIIGIKTIQPVIKALIEKKILISVEALKDKFTPKTISCYRISDDFLEEKELTELIASWENKTAKAKQLNAILQLIQLGKYQNEQMNWVEKKALIETDTSLSSLNTLEKNGIIIQERIEISRFEDDNNDFKQIYPLSGAQQIAYTAIKQSFDNEKVALLHGVTGSGKTEIYVQLIQEQLDLGKQVLFLLPEIALTTQLIQRLSAYFGDLIGIYHSKFNQNERVEIWNHILHNNPDKFRIILGARSSIFLPFQDLGLIIVDEEHESTFKQYNPSPRYNARDCSIVLSILHKANVLLGSATPSIESFYNAQIGKYDLIPLSERYGNIMLPEILMANVRKERKQKSIQGDFTKFLLDNIKEVLDADEQVILFQNRRGYTPLWMCEVCDWTPYCQRCDVSLTYHKSHNILKCHYCGFSSPPVGTCKRCSSNRLKMLGFGTEKVEDELALIFPDKVIKRMDLDTTRTKNAYSQIINDFANRKIDVLIGTQMVSKGLDFDNVNLVGVLDADMLLNRSDFRAFERSFQLMTQVAGRSGRRSKRGKVIIQTGDPDHWVLQHVISHDYNSFYKDEVIERKNYFYPPFFKIITITLRHRDENILNTASLSLAKSLTSVFRERVLGPEFPVVKRVNNLFLKEIKLKIERTAQDKVVKTRLQEIIDEFLISPHHKSVRVIVDVDPA